MHPPPNLDLATLLREGRSLADRMPRPEERVSALRALRARPPAGAGGAHCRPPAAASEVPPGLPVSGRARARRPPRVGIATADFAGPVRNGGIGTAYAALAEALAGAGHPVTVLYTGTACEAGALDDWRAHYARRGVELLVLAPPAVPLEGTWPLQASYLAYQQLRGRALDVLHFPDMFGGGFHITQAKRLGLAFARTTLVAGLHGPTVWHRLENGERIDREEHLALEFMERESVARADVLVSPSRYLLAWTREWGFRFPARVHVQPYVSPGAAGARPAASPAAGRRVTEVVFFGRLETRKGLELFCDAADLLGAGAGPRPERVTLLGKSGRVRDEDGAEYARRRASSWPFPVRIETSLAQEEALAHLTSRPALAVIASLADNTPNTVSECLARGIPFVATRTGGIPEMLAVEDREAVLVAPTASALAGRIAEWLRAGAPACRPAADAERVRREWTAWHEDQAAEHDAAGEAAPAPPSRAGVVRRRPLVSVCMATRNRPASLARALASIREQTYDRVEVVLVDDGSDSPEARAELDRLAGDFARRGDLLLSGPRRYPGAARNHAAAHARGEYLLFMDDDNLARAHEVETLVAAAIHSSVPLLTCAFDVFSVDPPPGGEPPVDFRWLPLGPALPLGMLANRFGDTNLLVRRDVFLGLGGFEEEPGVRLVEDWILLSRAALAGVEMASVPEPLFLYRRDDTHGQGPALELQHYGRSLAPYLEGEPPERKALVLYAAGLHHRLAAGEPPEDEGRLRARFERAHEVLALGPRDASRLDAERELEIASVAGAIRLRSKGRDPIAWLPVRLPAGEAALVRIEVTVRVPATLQLFWATRSRPELSEEQSATVGLRAGRSVRFVAIPAADHRGRLRLDPAMAPGEVLLHRLDVRCEPADGRVPGAASRLRRLAERLRRRST